jgi:2-keto-4-pentenoate hydratase
MTAAREADLMRAADMLLDARRTKTPIEDLPAELRPVDIDEVYFVQDRVAEAYDAIGGWKIGAGSPEATPLYAPMPLIWIAEGGCMLNDARHRFRGLEAEIAFRMGEDLPPRAMPYTRAEVIAAVASCHPAIEVLETALIEPKKTTKNSMLADLQMHGGFVYGPAVAGWESIDWAKESVTLTVDGIVRVERTGSNTSGDLVGLLPYLANQGAARTGGLKRGQWITTGSWTGNTPSEAGSSVEVQFTRAGRVSLRFA